MRLYRKITPIVEAVLWTGNNVEAVLEICPKAFIDEAGKLWIPAFVNMYCVCEPAYIVKDTTAGQLYRAYKPDDFKNIFEGVPNV